MSFDAESADVFAAAQHCQNKGCGVLHPLSRPHGGLPFIDTLSCSPVIDAQHGFIVLFATSSVSTNGLWELAMVAYCHQLLALAAAASLPLMELEWNFMNFAFGIFVIQAAHRNGVQPPQGVELLACSRCNPGWSNAYSISNLIWT